MIARAESALAFCTVIVGSLQMQRTQYALKRLLVAALILGRASAGAGQFCACMIAGVGIQPLFPCSCGQPQSRPPGGHCDGVEIQIAEGGAAEERGDVLEEGG